MKSYEIIDPNTGESRIIQSDTPPTQEEAARAFMEADKATVGDYAMEAVAAFNRPMAGLVDIAASPLYVAMDIAGVPYKTTKEMVGPAGQFAGRGALTDTIAAAGEVASISIPFGGAIRYTAPILESLVASSPGTLRNVLRVMGEGSVAQDVTIGALIGASGQVGANVGGLTAQALFGQDAREYGRMTGQFVGEMLAPVGLAKAMQRTGTLLNKFVQETLTQKVNPSELYGASDVLYTDIGKLGAYYTDDSLRVLANDLNRAAVDNNIVGLPDDAPIRTRINSVLRNINKQGEYYGTTFDYLHSVLKSFRNVAMNNADADTRRQAGAFVEVLTDFITTKGTIGGTGRTVDFSQPSLTAAGTPPPTTAVVPRQASTGLAAESQNFPTTPSGRGSSDTLEGVFSVDYENVRVNPGIPLTLSNKDLNRTIQTNLTQANSLWRRGSTLEKIDNVFKDASFKANTFRSPKVMVEQIVSGLAKIKNSPDFRRLSSAEQKALESAVSSKGQGRAFFEAIGDLGISSKDYVRTRLFGYATLAAAGVTANQPTAAYAAGGLAALETLSGLSRFIAGKIVQKDANYLRSLVAAGSDGEAIARIYLQKTPPPQRSSEALASLLIQGNAEMAALGRTAIGKSPLVSEAALIAGVINADAALEREAREKAKRQALLDQMNRL